MQKRENRSPIVILPAIEARRWGDFGFLLPESVLGFPPQAASGKPQRPELFSYRKRGKVASCPSTGIVPLSLLFDRSMSESMDKLENEDGIGPSNALWERSRTPRLCRFPNSGGMTVERWLWPRFRTLR
ncbi:hypothetical protein IEQ34_010733 [Dendrobium chrysotoxum]|uniref:Uncharacterized protein n=1 Tax=Dendrobium chrysotoxum TaxID=161865 RepID=A0AAV7GXW0_DENCH|nr:hypothetical protein IEQ34_010733 [Dendrobium chrysotoxum]